ncbi:hypothetical protein LY12_003715 [Prauserella alba]|nr:hypothetical protein [Prauserella alba]
MPKMHRAEALEHLAQQLRRPTTQNARLGRAQPSVCMIY